MRFSWMKIKLFFLLVLISGLFYSTISVNNLRDISKMDIYIDNPNNLFITKDSINNAVIEIIQFTNHDLIGIERINYEVLTRTTLIPEDIDYITFTNTISLG